MFIHIGNQISCRNLMILIALENNLKYIITKTCYPFIYIYPINPIAMNAKYLKIFLLHYKRLKLATWYKILADKIDLVFVAHSQCYRAYL